jgi:hypothetical protein
MVLLPRLLGIGTELDGAPEVMKSGATADGVGIELEDSAELDAMTELVGEADTSHLVSVGAFTTV